MPKKEVYPMPDTIVTDYFYGDESQQFTYFRIHLSPYPQRGANGD